MIEHGVKLRSGARYETVYTQVPLWVARSLGWRGRSNAVRASLLSFGLLPLAIFCFGFLYSFDTSALGLPLTINVLIAASWIIIGPVLTMVWERRFRALAITISRRQTVSIRSAKKAVGILDFYKRWAKWSGIAWIIFTLSYFFLTRSSLEQFTTLYSNKPMLALTILNLSAVSFVCGYGCCGVIQAIFIFHNLPRLNISWRSFHPDGKGGYGFLGSFALATTFAFAGGVVVLPAAISIGAKSGEAAYFGYSLVAIYTLLLLAVFSYSILRIQQAAREAKEAEIKQLLASMDRKFVGFREAQKSVDQDRHLANFQELAALETRLEKTSTRIISPELALGAFSAIFSPFLSIFVEKGVGFIFH